MENVEGKAGSRRTETCPVACDVIPDLPRQAKHVPSMEIVEPGKGAEKIS